MNTVSVYIKGGQTSPNYYRIYQYTNKIKDLHFKFRTMTSNKMHDRYMPLSKQPIYIKGYVLMIMYFRILYYLLADYINPPSAIIITRRVINKIMPWSYKCILERLSKRVPIIWDFDDDIIDGKEVSQATFNFYAKISDVIFCTHQGLKNLIPLQYQNKVVLLPTTDGDMYEHYNDNIKQQRLETFKTKIKIVWVATSVNLPHLLNIASTLDKYAKMIKEKTGKIVELSVICNAPLNFDFKNILLKNIKWTRADAVKGILEAHIGIMPLMDTRYSKGKGGFKLVQYLSTGLPCIGSDIGFNKEVIDNGCGYLVKNDEDWGSALLSLSELNIWSRCSENAYNRWLNKFSFIENLNIWRKTLTHLINYKE